VNEAANHGLAHHTQTTCPGNGPQKSRVNLSSWCKLVQVTGHRWNMHEINEADRLLSNACVTLTGCCGKPFNARARAIHISHPGCRAPNGPPVLVARTCLWPRNPSVVEETSSATAKAKQHSPGMPCAAPTPLPTLQCCYAKFPMAPARKHPQNTPLSNNSMPIHIRCTSTLATGCQPRSSTV
jgi:hypothetical protein